MKIAVTSTGDGLASDVDGRFGRCNYFVIVDTETMELESIDNQAQQAIGGAGVEAAQTISSSGAEAVITGNVGPNAYSALSAAGVDIYTGATGSVRDAVTDYKEGNLRKTEASTTRGGRGRRR